MNPESGGTTGNYYQILDNNPPKRKVDTNNTYDFPEFTKYNKKPKTNVILSQAKFVTLKSINEQKPLSSYNVFLIEKALEGISSEKPEKITFTRDGNLLILTKSQSQTNRFLKASTLSNLCTIKAELHPTLNISKGVIHCSTLVNLSEKEITEGLSSQNVVDCKKITKFIEGKQVNTPLHILSFNLHDVPAEVNIAWEKCKVNPFIPTPMQCKNCNRIGHTKKHCKSEAKCVVCSCTEHDSLCEVVKCINCEQHHRSNNRSCPTFLKRQAIIKHKTINKCSYRESIQAINQISNKEKISSPVESLDEAIAYKTKLKSLLHNKINEIKQINNTKTIENKTNSQSNSQSSNPEIATTSSSTLLSQISNNSSLPLTTSSLNSKNSSLSPKKSKLTSLKNPTLSTYKTSESNLTSAPHSISSINSKTINKNSSSVSDEMDLS